MAEPTINGFPIRPGLVVSLRSCGVEWWTVQCLVPPQYDFWGRLKADWRVYAVKDHFWDGCKGRYFPPEVLQCLKPGHVMKDRRLIADEKEKAADPKEAKGNGDGEK